MTWVSSSVTVRESHLSISTRNEQNYRETFAEQTWYPGFVWSLRVYGGFDFRIGITTSIWPVEAHVDLVVLPRQNTTAKFKPVVMVSPVHQFVERYSVSSFLVRNDGTITCNVKFKILPTPVFKPLAAADFVRDADFGDEFVLCGNTLQVTENLQQVLGPVFECVLTNAQLDSKITVDDQSIEVSRTLLTMVSPVFRAVFKKNDNPETIVIEGFDFETVKEVMNWCHGGTPEFKSVDFIISMIRFAKKYDIKTVAQILQPHVAAFFSLKNFCTIVKYAWEYDDEKIKIKCAKYYRLFHSQLTLSPEFVDLDDSCKGSIIRMAATFGNNELILCF